MNDKQKRMGGRASKALWVTTPLCSVATFGAWRSWAFSSDLTVQRHAVIACICVVLACLVGLIVAMRGAKKWGLADAYAAVRPEEPTRSSDLPSSVPSVGPLRWRGVFGMIGFFAALVGVWGLVGGGAHSTQAAEIRDAGARVTAAPVTKVSHLERYAGRTDTDYSATVTVRLNGELPRQAATAVTLEARTHELLHPGEHLRVMYAPSDLALGAVHGDAAALDRLMSGRSMKPGLTWGLTIAMGGIAVVLIGATVLTGGFRSVTALDRGVRACRGSCAGVGRWAGGEEKSSPGNECLLVQTENGGVLHFWVEREASATAEAAGNEPVWACWRGSAAEPRSGQKTAAVLIGDSGWALQGEMWREEAQMLEQHQASPVGSGGAPIDERRTVRLWSPVSSWPLILPTQSLVCVAVALAAAGVCLIDSIEQWRWTFGVVSNLALLSAVASYVIAATRPARGVARKPSRTVATGERAG